MKYKYPSKTLLEPLTLDELDSILWLVRNVSLDRLRTLDDKGYKVLCNTANKVEAQMVQLLGGEGVSLEIEL